MIPLFKPFYDYRDAAAIANVLTTRWTGLGPTVEQFEKWFACYVGTKYAVAVNSGTSALNLAVKCYNKKNIITTPLTFVSTVSSIEENGCIIKYADIDPNTLNINPDEIDCNGIDAVIPVHYSGRPCDMDKIMWIAKKRNLVVIEDAAHACGATYNGKKVGSFGDLGCFSFHAVKNLSCGDGGMITTNNKTLYERLKRLRWCGISKSTYERMRIGWEYEIIERGYKYHMNDITAALGLTQLEKLDWMNEKRRRLAQRYMKAFRPHHAIAPLVGLPAYDDSTYKSSWHLFPIQVNDRDGLYSHLLENDIVSGVHYKPVYLFEAYKSNQRCRNVDRIWPKLLSLPMYPEMTNEEQDKVINTVLDYEFSHKTDIEKQSSPVLRNMERSICGSTPL